MKNLRKLGLGHRVTEPDHYQLLGRSFDRTFLKDY